MSILLRVTVVLFIIACLYGWIQSESVRLGSRITIEYPNITVVPRFFTLRAHIQNPHKVTVNGIVVLPDELGNISYPMYVQEGYTIVSVVASTRLGRETQKHITLFSDSTLPYDTEENKKR
ncbi:MAG: hypothetical protein QM526_00775 [Alphaproteobacteria bacterium]|nr:hypothetical protein [Alphaproteobacteria bacterium]